MEFRSKFGRVQELKDQKAPVGGVAVIKHQKRFIYNLVTKKEFYHKPTYDDLKSSLESMRKHMVIRKKFPKCFKFESAISKVCINWILFFFFFENDWILGSESCF